MLRVAGLGHTVVEVHNSPYAVHELTGPLPYLQDLETPQGHPAMVGRRQFVSTTREEEDEDEILQRMGSSQNNNSILNYLQLYRGIDLDRALDKDQQQQSILYTGLIQNDLEACLVALRYGDADAWEQIYRDQCCRAGTYVGAPHHHPKDVGSSNNNKQPWWSRIHPLASWQAWSERRQALSGSQNNHRRFRSTEHALATARQAYQVLEHQLVQKQTMQATTTSTNNNNPNGVSYLLGTRQPTVVDCLLWDHLMQALTDIYLVVVLAEFPQLLHYTQRIWDDYHFGVAVDDNDGKSSSVSVWNLEENALNAFNEVPLLPPRHPSSEEPLPQQQQHAVDLMKKLSVCHLPESLLLAQKTRQQDDDRTPSSQRRPLATWHRWRMGGPCWPTPPSSSQRGAKPSSTSGSTSTTRPADAAAKQEERIQRDYQRNDEIWLASVAATTLAVVLGFGFSGGSSSSRQ